MGKQASNGWFSPPQERTSSFERASATNDTRISLPAAHQQPSVCKTLTTPEPARFAQGSKQTMKMRRMKNVKRKDALVAALWRYPVIVDSEMRYLESSSSPTTVCTNHAALAQDRTTAQSIMLQTADSASVLGVQAAENWPGWSQDRLARMAAGYI